MGTSLFCISKELEKTPSCENIICPLSASKSKIIKSSSEKSSDIPKVNRFSGNERLPSRVKELGVS